MSEHREGIFNIHTSEDFYFTIQNALKNYQNSKAKRIEDLFFIIMGLNHLREWIAPNYNRENKAQTRGEEFYNEIFKNEDFRTVKELCNGSKHLKPGGETRYKSDFPITDWPDISSVRSIEEGPPSTFYANGEEVGNILERLSDFYRDRWFNY